MDQQPPQAPPPAEVPPPSPAPVVPPPVTTPSTTPASAPPYWQGGAEPTGPAPGVSFASFGARLIAYIVDSLLLGIVIVILTLVLVPVLAGTSSGDGEVSGAGMTALTVWIGVLVLISLLYFPFFWQRSGQTPGMRMLNIRVVKDADGSRLGWGSAILRYVGFFIDSIIFGLPIGFLWALFDSRRRAWHDLIGGTVVVKA